MTTLNTRLMRHIASEILTFNDNWKHTGDPEDSVELMDNVCFAFVASGGAIEREPGVTRVLHPLSGLESTYEHLETDEWELDKITYVLILNTLRAVPQPDMKLSMTLGKADKPKKQAPKRKPPTLRIVD